MYVSNMQFVPESARYYIARGNKKKAMAVLRTVARLNRRPMPVVRLKQASKQYHICIASLICESNFAWSSDGLSDTTQK